MRLTHRDGVQWNVAMFLLNVVVPAVPLNGSRVFANSLRTCGMSMEGAAKATVVTTALTAAGMIAYGIFAFPASFAFLLVAALFLLNTHFLVKSLREGTVGSHLLFSYGSPDEAPVGTEIPTGLAKV